MRLAKIINSNQRGGRRLFRPPPHNDRTGKWRWSNGCGAVIELRWYFLGQIELPSDCCGWFLIGKGRPDLLSLPPISAAGRQEKMSPLIQLTLKYSRSNSRFCGWFATQFASSSRNGGMRGGGGAGGASFAYLATPEPRSQGNNPNETS